MGKIMYVCEVCQDHNPEYCGRNDTSDLRIAPDGRQVCDDCYCDDDDYLDARVNASWEDLPAIQEWAPVS